MLYGYPSEAAANNWLHDCLAVMIRKVHSDVDAGNSAPVWPKCVPAKYRARLRSRHGLGTRICDYFNAISVLTGAKRNQVLEALTQQNEIGALLSGSSSCAKLSELPESVRMPVRSLYKFGFTLLSEVGIRDKHYRIICKKRPKMICPFCGMEFFDDAGGPREDIDHYLAVSIYPFAGANLRNLIPMGTKCNQRYKKTQNILYTRTGIRRKAFDPYSNNTTTVSLLQSVPFGAPNGAEPKWQVNLLPESQECDTWDQVFKIKERYVGVLKPQFREWLRPFARWWRITRGAATPTKAILLAGISDYIVMLRITEHDGRDFLRVSVFEMLRSHCDAGNSRLVRMLIGVIATGR